MKRMDDEMFESVVVGREPLPEAFAGDTALRARLEAHRAVRRRVRAAFDGVMPDATFVAQLRTRLVAAREPAPRPAEAAPAAIRGRFRRAVWPALAAAAVLLAVVIPLSVLSRRSQAQSAQQELALMHSNHESLGGGLHRDESVEAMAAHLRSQLDFDPGRPTVGPGESVEGCCVDRLMGRAVASYVVATAGGLVSVIATPDVPESMRMSHRTERQGRTVWACGFGGCRMAAVRVGEVTYVAVGRQGREALIELLLRIVPQADPVDPEPPAPTMDARGDVPEVVA